MKVVNLINKIKEENKDNKILIHCQSGVNRSASLVIGYLISQGNNFKKAIDMVVGVRPLCLSNQTFTKQLIAYASVKKLLE